MSDPSAPVRDDARYYYGQRLYEDAESHRSMPHCDSGNSKTMFIGVQVPRKDRRRRRRRDKQGKLMSTVSEDEEIETLDPSSTDPSTRVHFLLGAADEDEENGVEHEIHPIFCEMDELFQTPHGCIEWKETARWVRFEEDVEEGGERWSKPHVATLSLFSLFEVRNSVDAGEVLLECEGTSMEQISDILLDRLILKKKLSEDDRDQVRDVLLKKHNHLHDKKKSESKLGAKIRSIADIGRRHSSRDIEREPTNGNPNQSQPSLPIADQLPSCDKLEALDGPDLHTTPSGHKFDLHFLKKIPPGAETSNILVGSTSFLTQNVTAFIRLTNAVLLGDLTEVPVPTRFIYVLLGPPGQQANFREMGRSMATLMSDEIFHDVAYLAKNKEDLLAGVDEFLKSCTVLPPNEWDPSIRIEPPKEVPSQEGRKTGTLAPTPSSHNLVTSPSGSGLSGQDKCDKKDGPDSDGHGGQGLERTGRFCGGLVDDIKRKTPFYLSDIKDAVHVQTIGAFCFIYFACLTPIITFGGLLSDATEGYLGAMESILSGAICGVLYALFSGQPLTILGSTGPVLVFETILFKMCKEWEWEYLSFRMWVGVWICLILLLFVAFDLSYLVKFITRFTEESFAALIALIFIVEAFKKQFQISSEYPINTDWHPTYTQDFNCSCYLKPGYNSSKPLPKSLTRDVPYYTVGNGSNIRYFLNHSGLEYFEWSWQDNAKFCKDWQGVLVGSGCGKFFAPDVFYFSCLLFIGTFVIAYGFKMMRNARFFPNFIRSLISDFAVMTAILLMTLIDFLTGLQTPKLLVPDSFEPTLGYDARGWIIPPFGITKKTPWYAAIVALGPALLAVILIFLDQQITAVIVNRKENKLKKGLGYHLDLLVVSLLIGINSLLGIPWFVAATVLSINHVMALKIESECTAPGERPKFLGVRENRVTGFLVFLTIGFSVLITPVLRHIPMSVLYGVFLFMGISSLKGVQLVQRVSIWFMPQKYQPDYNFLRHVQTRRVHIFTLIQITCLALLWLVKAIKQISILFPIMVLAMVFMRKALDFVFEENELRWLDDIMPSIRSSKKLADSESIPQNLTETEMAPLQIIKTPEVTFSVSEEVGKTAIWKNLTGNTKKAEKSSEKNEKVASKKKHKKRSRKDGKSEKSSNKELAQLLDTPEIVIEPPSGSNTPDRRDSAT